MKTFHITLTVSENWIQDGFNLKESKSPESGGFDDLMNELHNLHEYCTAGEVKVTVKHGEHAVTAAEQVELDNR